MNVHGKHKPTTQHLRAQLTLGERCFTNILRKKFCSDIDLPRKTRPGRLDSALKQTHTENNEMIAMLDYWEDIVNHKVLKKFQKILFLWNKEKMGELMKSVPLRFAFGDEAPQLFSRAYELIDDEREEEGARFIQDAMVTRNKDVSNIVFTHYLKRERGYIQKVLWDVSNILIRSHLRRSGLVYM